MINLNAQHREKSKSPQHALAGRLGAEAGLNQAQIRVGVEIFTDHLQSYYSQFRQPGVISHTAVSIKEPPGRPIKNCTVVPVQLTAFHEADVEVMNREGSVRLRMVRLYRFCCEAREQGGLLSQEDLSVLLAVHTSTIRDLIDEWRKLDVLVPTRGAIKDIGPEPSHKRIIADLLARGSSTSQIRAMTKHSEGSIGRYQEQFGMVLYLLHKYPEASDDERCRVADISRKAYDVYVEVYRAVADRPDCRPHLERLRRRYELDPEGLAYKLPKGKAPLDDTSRQRLEQQTLPTSVRQTIQEDLGTTQRVAQAVTDDLMSLIEDSFRLTDSLRPGELVAFVDAHDPSFMSGERVADRKVIPVKLPLYTDEITAIWRSDDPVGTRRAQIAARIANAAAEQGGVMSIANLADLLHVRDVTMAKDLRELAVALHVEAPTKGILEDAGPTLTHKDLIVGLDHYGLTGDEISWLTRHAPQSRDRYIETYRRAETIMRLEGSLPDAEHLARVLRLRRHVAQQYVDLLHRYHSDGKSMQENAHNVTVPSSSE